MGRVVGLAVLPLCSSPGERPEAPASPSLFATTISLAGLLMIGVHVGGGHWEKLWSGVWDSSTRVSEHPVAS